MLLEGSTNRSITELDEEEEEIEASDHSEESTQFLQTIRRRPDSSSSTSSNRQTDPDKTATKYQENLQEFKKMHSDDGNKNVAERMPLTGQSQDDIVVGTKAFSPNSPPTSPNRRKKKWSMVRSSSTDKINQVKRATQFSDIVDAVDDKPTLKKIAQMIGNSLSVGSIDDLDLNVDEKCTKCGNNEDAVAVKIVHPCHDHTRDVAAEAKIVQAQQRSKASSGLLLVSSLLAAIATTLLTGDTEAIGASDVGQSNTDDFQGIFRTASIVTNILCIAMNLSAIVVLGLHDYLLQRTLSSMVDDPEYAGGLALLFMDNTQIRGLRTRAFFCTVYSLPTLMLGAVLHTVASSKQSAAAWATMVIGVITVTYMFFSIYVMMAQKKLQKVANKKRKVTLAATKRKIMKSNTQAKSLAFELKKEGYKDRLQDAATSKARSRATTISTARYKASRESAINASSTIARHDSYGM